MILSAVGLPKPGSFVHWASSKDLYIYKPTNQFLTGEFSNLNQMLESKLFEAATKGCTRSLQKLLNDDPLILDRVLTNCSAETPLHVAAMLGHIEFVKEIIRIKPEFTNEFNSQQSSPLHLASAKGHVDVVRALLSVDHSPCQARDRKGLTPVHLAAVKGRVEVMTMLLQARPYAAQLIVYGESILHLCVKHYQLEPLKLLVKTIGDPEFINFKDSYGNTILHLAVADKQVETINFLVTVATLKANELNLDGMTAMDILIRSRNDVRNLFIKQSLDQKNITNESLPHHTSLPNNTWENLLKQQDDWLEKKRSALMIVASLIATMAFQAGVSPPGGVWQDDSKARLLHDSHKAGFSVLARNHPVGYTEFYTANTTAFIASLSIILLLVSGLPIRRRLFMWILMVITWIAITATATTYLVSVKVVTPSLVENPVVYPLIVSFKLWLCLIAFLLIGHTVRLIKKMTNTKRTEVNDVAL